MTASAVHRALPFSKPAVLLVCDIQERFAHAIHKFDDVVATAVKLTKAAGYLGLPVLATEQYPQGLGSTVPQLASEIKSVSQHAIEPKREFSMAHGSRLLDMLRNATGKGHSYEDIEFILCGIEAHVCVLQTVQDLSQKGAHIHVVRDGISSCNGKEVNIAVQAMREAGADIATSESILFQLLGSADHPQFKNISRLIRESQARTHQALEALC